MKNQNMIKLPISTPLQSAKTVRFKNKAEDGAGVSESELVNLNESITSHLNLLPDLKK
jgi:hypothetical protein